MKLFRVVVKIQMSFQFKYINKFSNKRKREKKVIKLTFLFDQPFIRLIHYMASSFSGR